MPTSDEFDKYRQKFLEEILKILNNHLKSLHKESDFRKTEADYTDLLIRLFLMKSVEGEGLSLKDVMSQIEKKIIYYALIISRCNQKMASEILGLKPSALCEKNKRYELDVKEIKKDLKKLSNLDKMISTYLDLCR